MRFFLFEVLDSELAVRTENTSMFSTPEGLAARPGVSNLGFWQATRSRSCFSPLLACKTGRVRSDAPGVSTRASSVSRTRARTEAIWVQTTSCEALGHSPHTKALRIGVGSIDLATRSRIRLPRKHVLDLSNEEKRIR